MVTLFPLYRLLLLVLLSLSFLSFAYLESKTKVEFTTHGSD